MYSKVKKVFIGANISRTASVVIQGSAGVNSTAAAGEIFVCDKNKKMLSSGATYSDSDTIYIAEALATVNTITTKTGVSFTTRKLIFSDAITGAYVRNYSGQVYNAGTEKNVLFGTITTVPAVGDEYIVKIVYKDIPEHPGQFTHTYRWVSDSTTSTANVEAITDKFVSLINRHVGARVTASRTGATTTSKLNIVAKAIPECTTSLNDIDEYRMVEFEAGMYYIDASAATTGINNYIKVPTNQATVITNKVWPIGKWYTVRDEEKGVLQQQFGINNRVTFPVIKPDFRTVVNTEYDIIVIAHNDVIQTPDNGYLKTVQKETMIFLPRTAGQETNLLSALNTWMTSLPNGFNTLTL